MSFTDERKRKCLARELMMRRRVYPQWVASGRMTSQEAEEEIAVMEAILTEYQEPDLFASAPTTDEATK
jgi:hypothetical protein